VLAVLAFLVGLGLTIYAVAWKGQSFDLTQFGLGIGAMLAALGAALKLKEDTEPK
jgi:ABC-type enterobactin transport system permease subunit